MTATISPQQRGPRIDQKPVGGAVIVRPLGALDTDLVVEVRQAALQARAPVIIDLAESVLIDPAAVRRIPTGWEMHRPRMSIVCPRAAGRQLLAGVGLQDYIAIFEHVDDALNALASSTQHVDGWAPSPARP